jgi:NitT/TauT family transport system permease protein
VSLSARDAGRFGLPVLVVGVWEALYAVIGRPAMASPRDTVEVLVEGLGSWLSDVEATLLALLISFAISAVAGVLIGFALGLSRFWCDVMVPLLTAGYAIPKVALYPIFLLVFGLTLQGRIAFSVMHGILPLIIICADATATVPEVRHKLARAYGMSFLAQARHILLPSIVPSVVAGLRLAFGLCFLGLIVAEMFAAYEGMGFRLIRFMTLAQTPQIFAGVLLIAFVALFGTFLFLLWQEREERRIGKVRTAI